jgi:carboxyl-terminal processing protease
MSHVPGIARIVCEHSVTTCLAGSSDSLSSLHSEGTGSVGGFFELILFHSSMKSVRTLLAASIVLVTVISRGATDRATDADLHAVMVAVAQILEQSQYSQQQLSSSVGKQVLDTYLTALDPDKLFLTLQDVDKIRGKYATGLNDDILLGNLIPAKDIFAIFRRRVDERLAQIDGLLSARYDFKTDRTIALDRSKENWPADADAADHVWQDRIENELLSANLGDSHTKLDLSSIRRRYKDLQAQVDTQDAEDVVRIFLEAVAQTYDPHSEYLSPTDLDEFRIDTQLTMSGIGAELRVADGFATIDRIFSRGPADMSGKLHPGDRVVGVAEGNGPFVDIRNSNLAHITKLVLGKNGSVVRLRIIAGHAKKQAAPRVVSLVRHEIRLTDDAARAEIIDLHLSGGTQRLGWITVPSFYEDPDNASTGASASRDVAALVKRLKQERIEGLVVDLRNNGGGSVEEALRMIGLFINQGPALQLKDPAGDLHIPQEPAGNLLYNGPLVVLDNRLTASASEIFSAAMQDYRRAVVVGDSTTFGKGTVQAIIDLNRVIDQPGDSPDAAGALKVTIEKMYRVTGDSLQLKGVASDIQIPSLTESDSSTEIDMDHRLERDEVKPVSFRVTPNGKALFSDELRRRSADRIKRNPLFRDMLAEVLLTDAKIRTNRVSLNERVRKSDLAQLTHIRNKMDRDRNKSSAQDRNKYYELTLLELNKSGSRPANNESESDRSAEEPVVGDATSSFPSEPASASGEQSSDALAENEAITKETLNILSDLVSLNTTQQMAANPSQIGPAPFDHSGKTNSATRSE